MVHQIEVVTFKGCQPTMEFRELVEQLLDAGRIELNLALHMVPSAESSEAMGLFGSPTILIDGREYQRQRRGPAGFY